MTRYIKRTLSWISITVVFLVVSMCAVLFFTPKPALLNGLSFSRAIYDNQHALLRLTLSADSKYRLYTPLSDMSPELIEATLLQEDQYFYWHLGVNPFSLIKATWQTYGLKSRRMGASTITMQVARMRFGLNSKTLRGKVWQMIRAVQLEMYYSKEEILEAYLNLAPYGNNVEGVGAASRIYFGKLTKELSLPEALTLTVIPQNPTKRIPDRGLLKVIRDKLYLRWLDQHPEDKNKQSIMALPLQIQSLRHLPFLAPHFVNTILTESPIQQHDIVTTLDLRLQKIIEKVTRHYLARKTNIGVNNAAILLVDTRDMSVKAMLGSSDFFNSRIQGQINGVEIKRSPGSTLKPFIYALALDQGLIHPATVLKDVPRSFGSYNPENFDYDFAGPIKAQDALVLSRNIPAVYLADQLKQCNLYQLLQKAGVKNLKSESYYGLALVLGGAEVSMRELLRMYAALANNGVLHELKWTTASTPMLNQRLFSPEASFLVLDMLQNTALPNAYDMSYNKQSLSVAWKTGTSSGFRDAWTVGVFGPYVMAVWVGHFNNQSNPALIGKEMAAPLFFEIVNAMTTQLGALPKIEKHTEQMQLTKVDVCKASGMLPTRYCTETEKVWFIPGKSPIHTDTTYREIAINTKTGLRACKFNDNTRFEIYEFWSSDLLKIFKRAGIERRVPPAYDTACTVKTKRDGFHPQIASPQSHVNYITRIESDHALIIPFTAVVDADVNYLHWFLNETYLGKTTRDKAFLWNAKPGRYVIRVVDDYGRADAHDLVVNFAS